MQNLWYLVAAYALIWAVLFLYVLSIARRQMRLDVEVAALAEVVRSREQADGIVETELSQSTEPIVGPAPLRACDLIGNGAPSPPRADTAVAPYVEDVTRPPSL